MPIRSYRLSLVERWNDCFVAGAAGELLTQLAVFNVEWNTRQEISKIHTKIFCIARFVGFPVGDYDCIL